MVWDWTIRITDIVMVAAIIIGPILAVRITEILRHKKDKRDRKIHIFRNLMATRSATLAPEHIQALNLVDLEFHSSVTQDKVVLDAGRLYMDHLRDQAYPKETWQTRRAELLVELLYEMSKALGYYFDKVQIKAGSYYPSGYGEMENEQQQIRKSLLEVLQGTKQIPVLAGIFPMPSLPENKQQTENQDIKTDIKNV